MEHPNYYAIIPASVRYDDKLVPNAKLLYAEITALSNKEGRCWAGDAYFMKLYSVKKRTIQSWLKQLEDNGYINREVIYKDGVSGIEKRYITLTHKSAQPYSRNMHTPIAEICVDNNTSNNTTSNNTLVASKDAQREQVDEIVEMWNQIEGLPQVRRITETSKRYKYASARLKEEGFDTVAEVIQKVASSDFLRGKNRNNWTANFEWAMTASNFIKILEDTYINKESNHEAGRGNNSADKLERIHEEGRRAIEEFDFENFDGTF